MHKKSCTKSCGRNPVRNDVAHNGRNEILATSVQSRSNYFTGDIFGQFLDILVVISVRLIVTVIINTVYILCDYFFLQLSFS